MPTGRFLRTRKLAPWLALMVCAACNRSTPPVEQSSASVPAVSKPAALSKAVFRPSPQHSSESSEAQVGQLKLRLAQPDHADHPTAWEGPLEIEQGSASCQSDVSLVTAVYASPDIPVVLVVSYSGSLTYVDFIDKSCKHAWAQIKAFTEGIQVSDDRLTVLPGCEGSGAKGLAQCSSAQVYKFDGNSQPKLDQTESLALTKKIIGVEFEGSNKILHPKSPDAKVMP